MPGVLSEPSTAGAFGQVGRKWQDAALALLEKDNYFSQ